MCGGFAWFKKKPLGFIPDSIPFPGKLPRYNIRPGQKITVIKSTSPREYSECLWGLTAIAKQDSVPHKPVINARAESINTVEMFRKLFDKHRCAMPSNGYFEWSQKGQPYFIFIGEKKFIYLAGIWKPPLSDLKTDTCAIITTTASPQIDQIHHRMPVILLSDHVKLWLSDTTDIEALKECLVQYSADDLTYYPVSKRVNSSKIDDATLIEPFYGGQSTLQFG